MRRPDSFSLAMLSVIAIASIAPPSAGILHTLSPLATAAVALLFFVHGASLARDAVLAGIGQWRLHLFVLGITFLGFPLLLVPLTHLPLPNVPDALVLGFLYLAVLPSAVSSSIAFTAMAGGNVPAAICSAALSSVFGLMLTPLLLTVLVGHRQSFPIAQALIHIVWELLLPFVAGQLCRPLLRSLLEARPAIKPRVDQGVILLIVYLAFANAMRNGIWHDLPSWMIVATVVFCAAVLGLAFSVTTWLSRRLGFSRDNEIAAVFCGSKKSLASGLPMAKVLFAGNPALGLIVLPIMCYNQLQILIGPLIAQRYARRHARLRNDEAAEAGNP